MIFFCFGFNPGSFMLRMALVALAQRFGTLCARAGQGVGWWCPIWWADVSAEKAARMPLRCWVVVWPILDITRIGHRGEVCRCLLSHDHMITYWIVSICWSTQWSIFQQAMFDETGFQDNGWQQMDIAKALVVRARDVRGDPSTSLGEERQGPWEVHGDTETDQSESYLQ